MRIPTYLARLLRTEMIGPTMVRITLGGEGLAGFSSEGVPDERVKLFFSRDGGAPALPEISERGYEFPPGSERPLARTFTLRRWREASGEADIDIALHDGAAANWARRARPGQELGIAGPTGGYAPAGSSDLPHFLLGDASALPAIAGILEALPGSAQATALIEVEAPEERLELESPATVDPIWLYRSDTSAGFGVLLAAAAAERRSELARARVWAGGEAASMRSIRRLVRDELELPRDRFRISGYWRHRLDEDEAIAAHMRQQEAARAGGGDRSAIEDAGLY